ncbi:shikimate dehydrogenase [Paraferrimonas haliotis]|uniref:Shikimate dehydrogenase (NADP(+)) n=1 Tax=Paraferrimonas haliotis TaxID=2013866 RepID=A0AA37TSA8_9GAMM|nr:shikimate dehydrogenase [Paraferrimonas haliotis]GLS84833.1 shikimate dehydrogenase (NADP(+)) [Paraferrimonas haliotis]
MDSYAVIGNPIGHSQSPQIHAAFARQLGHSIDYSRLLAPIDGFEASVERFIEAGGRGMSVTVPFKEIAYERCNQLSSYAQSAQAVNALKFEQGRWVGHNTDGLGLVADLIAQGIKLSGINVLILGAGGAAKGILLPLLESGIGGIDICNRTHDKAVQLSNSTPPNYLVRAVSMTELTESYDLIINSTSASLQGINLPIPSSVVSPSSCCYDLMYSSEETPFNQWARELGVTKRFDGLGMLVHQAAFAYEFWRGVKPDALSVMEKLRS